MKKTKLLGIAIIGAFFGLNLDVVKADDMCTYKNYYFLAEINSPDTYTPYLNGTAATANYQKTHSTTFANSGKFEIVDGATFPTGFGGTNPLGQFLTIVRTGTDSETTFTLDTFYNNYKLAMSGTDGVYTDESQENTYINYITHGDWVENDTGSASSYSVDFSSVSNTDLIAGSVISTPSTSSVFGINDANLVTSTIVRDISQTDFQENATANGGTLGSFQVAWNDTNTSAAVLTPVIYYVTYSAPCSAAEYVATAHYYLKDTTTKVQDDSQIGEQLASGYSGTYTCPIIDGYTLNTTTEQSYTINNANADIYCYYTQGTGENVTSNVSTADVMVWIAIGVGLVAVGFAIWYYNKYYRKKAK